MSSAAAVILTHYFGDNFAYTDTVEERFGLKARKFRSFYAAARESGLSRFYGGIHFMDAIENGQKQGAEVGNWVIKTLEKSEMYIDSSFHCFMNFGFADLQRCSP